MSKSGFLSYCLIVFLLIVFSGKTYAQVNWTGSVSSDWANGSNWSAGVVPGPTDNVQIGVMKFTAQPAITSNVQIHNLTFGASFQVVLTIQSGFTLIVSNKIVQDHSADNNAPVTLVTGAGTLTCNSIMIGDLTSPRFVQTKTTTFATKLANFNIIGDINLNSVTAILLTGGVTNNNSLFSLQEGMVSLGGKINTNNSLPKNCGSFGGNNPNDKFSIDINSNQDAILKLTDSNAVNILNPNYATVDFFNYISGSGRSKVEYAGNNQLVYTNTIAGVDASPYGYQDLTISGTGTKTAGTDSTFNQLSIGGNLLINSATLDVKTYAPETLVNGNFRNTGAVNFGTSNTTINGASFFNSGSFNAGEGVLQFSGSVQALVDSTLSGTNFRKVTFNHAGIKEMQAGKFNIIPNGKVRLSDTATLNVASGTLLTIRSDSTGSAAIAALINGTKVTGIVNVERFDQGSTYLNNYSARSYRTYSSPVNYNGALSGERYYNVDFIKGTNDYNGEYTTGPSGGGFVADGPSTLEIYREDVSDKVAIGCRNCGVLRGINKINYADPSLLGTQMRFTTLNIADTTFYMPIGNGLISYFRGNKVTSNGTTSGTKTTAPYNYPESVTLTHTGVINQADVKVREWYKDDYYFSFTNSPDITNTTSKGLIFLGNPYPAPINLDNLSTTDSTSYLYGPNMSYTIYDLNESNSQYNAYQINPAHNKKQIYYGTGIATNIVKMGQGFAMYVNAASSNPYAASLTFREQVKFDVDAGDNPGSFYAPVHSSSSFISTQQFSSNMKRSLVISSTQKATVSAGNNLLVTGKKGINKAPLKNSSNKRSRSSKTTADTGADQFFRLKLIHDTINYDDILFRFGEDAADSYNPKEDAYDLGGTEEASIMLSSYSSDHIPLSINKIPPPAHSKSILLFTDAKESGSYSLLASELKNIPANYKIMLKDKLTEKILDLRALNRYKFMIDKNKKASFGDRFELIISKIF